MTCLGCTSVTFPRNARTAVIMIGCVNMEFEYQSLASETPSQRSHPGSLRQNEESAARIELDSLEEQTEQLLLTSYTSAIFVELAKCSFISSAWSLNFRGLIFLEYSQSTSSIVKPAVSGINHQLMAAKAIPVPINTKPVLAPRFPASTL